MTRLAYVLPWLLALALPATLPSARAQPYAEQQTRHRFAQLTLGLDVEGQFGGYTQVVGPGAGLLRVDLPARLSTRLLIGGTHFWGHADFYIAVPLNRASQRVAGRDVTAYRGVETAFKFYPWRLTERRLRPYLGASISSLYFEQDDPALGSGPELDGTRFPLLAGLTYRRGAHLLELGAAYNYRNGYDYYVSPTREAHVGTGRTFVTLGYKHAFDTTLGAERDWASGATQRRTDTRSAAGELDDWYFGAGLSSAFWLGASAYNRAERPYVRRYEGAFLADLTAGYYADRADLNVALAYRGYRTGTDSYGVAQALRRRSLVLEATKYLFDYHGFVPFVGPAISHEWLSFTEHVDGTPNLSATDTKLAYGLTFGWDIRPDRLQSFILRTNLRYFPGLALDTPAGREVSFRALEFNFIQLVVYPERMFGGGGSDLSLTPSAL